MSQNTKDNHNNKKILLFACYMELICMNLQWKLLFLWLFHVVSSNTAFTMIAHMQFASERKNNLFVTFREIFFLSFLNAIPLNIYSNVL